MACTGRLSAADDAHVRASRNFHARLFPAREVEGVRSAAYFGFLYLRLIRLEPEYIGGDRGTDDQATAHVRPERPQGFHRTRAGRPSLRTPDESFAARQELLFLFGKGRPSRFRAHSFHPLEDSEE